MDGEGCLPSVRVGDWAMVVLPVEIDVSCAGRVGDGLNAALADGVRVVVADLSGTGFCDSSGVRTLVLFHRRAAARGAEVRMVVTSPTVRRVFELMGVDGVLPVYGTLGEAMADAPSRGGGQPDPAPGPSGGTGRVTPG
jgi:anti-sigma B factor antagonist